MPRQPPVSTGRDIEAGFGQVRGRRRYGGIPQHYTIQEAAELLNVSHRTVRRWIATRDLIVHRVNSVVRIAETDLRAFLALHRES